MHNKMCEVTPLLLIASHYKGQFREGTQCRSPLGENVTAVEQFRRETCTEQFYRQQSHVMRRQCIILKIW